MSSEKGSNRRTVFNSDGFSSRRRFLKRTGAASVLLTGFAGCAQRTGSGGDTGGASGSNGGTTGIQGSSKSSSPPDKIKIGMTNALSGANADTGELYSQAYEMAIKDINEGSSETPYQWEGGGIYLSEYDTRVPVEVIIRDSQSSQDRAVNQYRQLIQQENIVAAIGPYSSGVTFAVGSVLESNGIPWIADAAASPKIFKQGWNYAFSVELPVTKWNIPQVEWLAAAKPEPNRLGVIHAEEAVTTAGAESTVEYAKKNTNLNAELIGSYPPDASDLSSLIQKAQSKGVDVFIDSGYVNTSTVFVRQLYSLGVDAKAIGVGLSVGIPGFYETLGEQASGVHGPQLWHPAITRALPYNGAKQFVKAYQKQYNQSPDYHVANGFDAVNIIAKAIEKAGETNSDKIRNRLANGTYERTLRGSLTFGDDGVLKGTGSIAAQIQGSPSNRSVEVIAPESDRTAEPIYPL